MHALNIRRPRGGGAAVGVMLLVGVARAGAAQSAREWTVTVVATTDIHAHVREWDYTRDREAPWGLSRLATLVDSLRRTESVVLVDAGDLIQGGAMGTFYAGNRRAIHPVIDAMNVLGYDALTPGNHEFDFGVGFLDSTLADALFPVVTGNIYRVDRNALAFRENVVFERGGVRVGVTGFTTPGTMLWDRAQLRGLRRIRPILGEAERVLGNLANDGAELKIVLAHSGLGGGSSYNPSGTGAENVAAGLARLPVPPDLVIVGHSHRSIVDTVIGGVHFVQPAPWARSAAVVRVTLRPSAAGVPEVVKVRAEQVALGSLPPQATFVRRSEAVHQAVRGWANTAVGRTTERWPAQVARAEDTPIIDFVNEVQRRRAGTQLSATAVFNPGAGFPSGVVRRRDVVALYPYENTLVAVRIDGATLRAYLERSARYFNVPDTGPVFNPRMSGYDFDIVSGVDYVIDLDQPAGSRVRQLSFNGRLVTRSDTFTLALSNYRQVGGGRFDMLRDLPVVYDRGESIRDLVLAEIEQAGILRRDDYFTPSWRIVPPSAAEAVRVALGAPPRIPVERILVRVLATTDYHASLESGQTSWSEGRLVGGVDALVRWFDSAATCGCPIVRLDAGDHLRGSAVGDPTFGFGAVRAFNRLKMDATVITPGDVTWGLDTLRARQADSRYRWLGANIVRPDGAAQPDWVTDWMLIERDSVAIAVIGVTAPGPESNGADSALSFVMTDPVPAVTRAVSSARNAGADAVILLAHLDAFCDDDGCRGGLIDLMNHLEPGLVDLVVGGHSDTEATALINGMALLLPGSYGLSFGRADVISRRGGRHRVESAVQTVWDDIVGADSLVPPDLMPEPSLDAPLVTLRFAVPNDSTGESPMGRLLADAYRNVTRAHVAIVPVDRPRGGFRPGVVTPRRVYDAVPVRDVLVGLDVPGAVVRLLLEQALEGGTPLANVSGIRVRYDPDRPAGRRVRRVEFVDGERMRDGQTYRLGVSAAVARGVLRFAGLTPSDMQPVGASDYRALLTYLRRLGPEPEPPARPRWRTN